MILEGEIDEGDEQLETEIREHVAKRIGKLARPKRIIWTADVPKTRSGKIMRRLLRDIAEGRELGRRDDAARAGRDAGPRRQGRRRRELNDERRPGAPLVLKVSGMPAGVRVGM